MNRSKFELGNNNKSRGKRTFLSVLLVAIGLMAIIQFSGQTIAQDFNNPLTQGTASSVAQWSEMGAGSASGGGISSNSGDSWVASLGASTSGTPKIAWQDLSAGDWEVYVRSWNGSAWVELGSGSASGGGISLNSGDSVHPSLAVAQNGRPTVAWEDYSSGNGEIYVRRWNGSSWVDLGTGSASGGGISANGGTSENPSLGIGLDGTSFVAWADHSTGVGEIYIRRFNGSSWVEMGTNSASGGGISNNSIDSAYPAVAVDLNNRPIVAWHDYFVASGEIYVKRWNGSSWLEMGADSASGGGISNNSGASRRPSLVIGSDGNPIIAWEDKSSGNMEIYVKRWNGSSWVAMGSGSASGGGISNNSGDSQRPSLAIGNDGRPIVAWSQVVGSNREIYVKRFNGSTWVEMGAGSASGGGVSQGGAISWEPSLAVASNGIPIAAWEFDPSVNSEIYVKAGETGSSTEEYTLTIRTEGSGAATANPSQSTYPAGTSVTLTAYPSSGWEFVGWGGDLSGSSNPASLIMDGNKNVTAVFEEQPLEYTLTVYTQGSGTVTVNPSQSTFPAGTTAILTAYPSRGWSFNGWSGDLTGTTNPKSLLMNGNKVVTGNFNVDSTGQSFRAYLPVIISRGIDSPDFTDPNEQEPNDGASQANGAIISGRSYHGVFNETSDIVDYYYFYIERSRIVEIVLENIPHGMDYDVVLHDSMLRTVAFSLNAGNLSENVRIQLPMGLYYIQVHNAGEDLHEGGYTLRYTARDLPK